MISFVYLDQIVEKSIKKAINESIIHIKSNLNFFEKLLLLISKKSEIGQNLKDLSKKKEKLLSEYSKLLILKTNIQNELLESVNIIKYYEEKYQIQRSEYEDELKKVKSIENKYKTTNSNNFADDKFFEDITNNNISQKACPWTNDEYDKLREELFYRALILQKSFVQNAKGIKQNIRMLCKVWGDDGFYTQDKQEFFKHTFATLFLLIPVVSTTFASVGQLLKYIGKEELGTLIIDESGQAMPQSAIGALWRTRKAIVVGDPLQVEPVVTSSRELSKMFINQLSINPDYGSKELSVQELADLANPFGGEINDVSVGSPLVVHRRCIDPMFEISNTISYGKRMFNETGLPKDDSIFSIDVSKWIDCKGTENGNKDHYVSKQGEEVLKLIMNAYSVYGEKMFEPGAKIIYIISPFTSVIQGIKAKLKKEFRTNQSISRINNEYLEKWFKESMGTVHKFQGKEANEVILVLGCDENSGRMAASWAGRKANILNVAVTRAKFRLAIVGDAELWSKVEFFEEAYKILTN